MIWCERAAEQAQIIPKNTDQMARLLARSPFPKRTGGLRTCYAWALGGLAGYLGGRGGVQPATPSHIRGQAKLIRFFQAHLHLFRRGGGG
ncbi:MAG TPA: hypothetical protein DHV63_08505 [Pseudomonas sp.]|nr:hypothetical protein [Pseudomonas sp.]